ncbi:MAG: hypothetical protein A2114_02450 [Candidatus Vogelbacteria bacterium GWA1_51_14]|uniref:Purple acid phosphatase N-terminal domain-containing protein n=1 Tax=Candidatus Vogelbacteria bacterium GWA1_51_14 TaxID=1802435 RepID=A0A1G2QAY2_9BACT|nr:MAG: hypothetical protein A2114_02450 [Candidatus Vogelbacteria bacterium GWA1_51_14]
MIKKISLLLSVLLLVAVVSWPGNQPVQAQGKSNTNSNNNVNGDYNYQEDERLPRGLRTAPGIEKRVENGKGLPFGWWLKLFGGGNNDDNDDDNSTTTPAILTISGITETVGTSTVTIGWHTNLNATSEISYGTSSTLVATSSVVASSSALVSNHAIALSGLAPDTTYYYRLTSTADSKTATSSINQFTTDVLPIPDTNPPNIIFTIVTGVDEDSARLVWVTNEAADSKLWVSTSSPVNISGAPNASSTNLTYYHDLTAIGLASTTTYYYFLSSADAASNLATTSGSFITD